MQGTTQATAASASPAVGGSIGDCATDQFSITGPKQSSPVICGTNTGQHSKKAWKLHCSLTEKKNRAGQIFQRARLILNQNVHSFRQTVSHALALLKVSALKVIYMVQAIEKY